MTTQKHLFTKKICLASSEYRIFDDDEPKYLIDNYVNLMTPRYSRKVYETRIENKIKRKKMLKKRIDNRLKRIEAYSNKYNTCSTVPEYGRFGGYMLDEINPGRRLKRNVCREVRLFPKSC
jgi:hypothetical protein